MYGYANLEEKLKEINDSIKLIEECSIKQIEALQEQINTWESEILELKNNIKNNKKLIKDMNEAQKNQMLMLVTEKTKIKLQLEKV